MVEITKPLREKAVKGIGSRVKDWKHIEFTLKGNQTAVATKIEENFYIGKFILMFYWQNNKLNKMLAWL